MAQIVAMAQDIVQYGPYGNQQSDLTFNFVEDSTDRIKTVRIGSGYIVDGIGFDIIDQSGKIETRYYGGQGHEGQTIRMLDDEYITQISGFAGDYSDAGGRRLVAQIKIHTNYAPNGYGPYGRMLNCKNTEPFISPAPKAGGRIVGFFGATGNYLESIGVSMRTA